MGSQLQQLLWSLCFHSGWKYAVFWKLKHRARRMLVMEDAYYDCNESPDRKWFNSTVGNLSEFSHLHDPLGLVVARMSHEVYSLGEGIVGQVAVSGKHAWIFSDQNVPDSSSSSSEYFGRWRTHFSAGIKTIAVLAIVPHGVIQLGSLHKIAEDPKLIDHIRNALCELQESLAGCVPGSVKNNMDNHCLGLSNETHKTDTHGSFGCSVSGNGISHPSSSQNILSRKLGQGDTESLNNEKHVGESSDSKNAGKGPVKNVMIDQSSLSNTSIPTNESQMAMSNFSLEDLDHPAFRDQDPELSSLQWHQTFGNSELPIKSSCVNMQISPFSFGPGYELYEALGQSFPKQNDCVWEAGKSVPDMAIEISEGMGSCTLMLEDSDTHLLDAVVAKVSHKGNNTGSDKSCHETGGSLLTAEKTHCTSVGTISSTVYSFDKDASSSLNSGIERFKAFSSPSSSRGSEHLVKPREAVKTKKRARPGESSRPRPRDRQLIQDRIKELRELVPSGSKCSIDSLLERTIKHMLFLQSVTKHEEKLNKCSASKLLDKDAGMRRFSCREQGSSWAMEVGNDQKVYPIIVENINMNGQMLVEMLCEECSQFLEIAEAIRSLGLTILKGVSEAYGNKTWMCFVVENNRSMHRMDILWSLMQLLQPNIAH